jgi:Flp pilus assembly protein TadD
VGSLSDRPVCRNAARPPHDSIDHATACGLFQLKREFRRAIEHCDAALRDDPTDDQSLSNRGSAHLSLGNFEEALRDFNEAMRFKPQNARNFFNRALVHAARKDHQRRGRLR